MEEQNSNLDNFLANGESLNSQSVSSSPNVINRPKLKKIKRPKIRSTSDIPPAPQKVYLEPEPSAKETSTINTVDNSIQQDDTSSSEKGTSLVTSTTAQALSMDTEPKNSYILENLPPELDYISDGDESGAYGGSVSLKKVIGFTVLGALLGFFIGAFAFSSHSEEKHGLEDVIINPDVPQGRARCGLTEKSQACVFYVMNCYKQELTGRDFYKLAATLTGREEYMIENENMRYSTTRIKPGAFAQLNIPALK